MSEERLLLQFKFITSTDFGPGRRDQVPRRRRGLIDAESRAHVSRITYARKRRRDVTAYAAKKQPARREDENAPVSIGSHELEPPNLFAFKGNSDPFSCFPVTMTPLINQTLTFMRDICIPAGFQHGQYIAKVDKIGFSKAAVADVIWNGTKRNFDVEGITLATVSSYLGYWSRVVRESVKKQQLIQLALLFLTKSSKILRTTLESAQEDVDKRDAYAIFMHTFWLHRASTNIAETASARLYADMLVKLIEKGIDQNLVDHGTLMFLAMSDIDASARFMWRTFLDYSWFENAYTGFWARKEPELPTFPHRVFLGIHANVEGDNLRKAFIVSRCMHEYTDLPGPGSAWGITAKQKNEEFLWFSTKSTWAIGTAMNIYFSMRDGNDSGLSPGRRYTQAALALAFVYELRAVVYENDINGIDIRDCAPTIMPELHTAMARVYEHCTSQEVQVFADAHIWILFMGAFWEERQNRSGAATQGKWFQVRLVEKALLVKKASWSRLKPLLQRFVYADWMEPTGAKWFDNLVSSITNKY